MVTVALNNQTDDVEDVVSIYALFCTHVVNSNVLD